MVSSPHAEAGRIRCVVGSVPRSSFLAGSRLTESASFMCLPTGNKKGLLTKTVPIANDARSTFGRPSDYSVRHVGHSSERTSSGLSCRNNPVAGIMTLIPLTELPAQLRCSGAYSLVPLGRQRPIELTKAGHVYGPCLDRVHSALLALRAEPESTCQQPI